MADVFLGEGQVLIEKDGQQAIIMAESLPVWTSEEMGWTEVQANNPQTPASQASTSTPTPATAAQAAPQAPAPTSPSSPSSTQ